MTALQTVNQGTAPAGADGDTVRSAFTKMNSNVAVLNTQATLTSVGTVNTASALDGTYWGKRVPISLAVAGTVNVPAANSGPGDAVLLLRNPGSTVVTLAPASGSGDTLGISTLNPGESVLLITDGSHGIGVLFRGRTTSNNEVVNGTLTVGGGINGNLPISGKVNALNRPNILINGSAEFGLIGGWGPYGFVGAYVGGLGDGSYFTNPNAISANSYVGSTPFPVQAGGTYNLSGEIYAVGVTSGAAWMRFVFLNSSGTVVSTGPSLSVANGQSWAPVTGSAVAPTGATQVYVQLAVENLSGNPAAASGGAAWRRIKVELGATPSLYSQEASLSWLQKTPQFGARPTWTSGTTTYTLWDSGNLANPLSNGVTNTTPGLLFASGQVPNFGAASGTSTQNSALQITNGGNSSASACISFNRANSFAAYFGIDAVDNALRYGGWSLGTNSYRVMHEGLSSFSSSGTFTAAQWVSSSDRKLKKRIRPIVDALQKVLRLRGVTYEMRRGEKVSSIGVIAQDVRKVFPELVHEVIQPDGKMHLGVNYAGLSGALIEAFKALHARVEELEARQ